MMLIHDITADLSEIIETTAKKFNQLDTDFTRKKPAPGKWSIQEILGHLVDSAINNQHRFVRAQQADILDFPAYDQDHWVRVQDYNQRSWPELVELWRLCNRHLVQTVSNIPKEKLSTECRIGTYEPVTLQYLIEDYLVHLKHHLAQIEELILLYSENKK